LLDVKLVVRHVDFKKVNSVFICPGKDLLNITVVLKSYCALGKLFLPCTIIA
jgi:hypothetical protein